MARSWRDSFEVFVSARAVFWLGNHNRAICVDLPGEDATCSPDSFASHPFFTHHARSVACRPKQQLWTAQETSSQGVNVLIRTHCFEQGSGCLLFRLVVCSRLTSCGKQAKDAPTKVTKRNDKRGELRKGVLVRFFYWLSINSTSTSTLFYFLDIAHHSINLNGSCGV